MKWQVFAINLYLLPISDAWCQLFPWSNAMFDWSPPSNCSRTPGMLTETDNNFLGSHHGSAAHCLRAGSFWALLGWAWASLTLMRCMCACWPTSTELVHSTSWRQKIWQQSRQECFRLSMPFVYQWLHRQGLHILHTNNYDELKAQRLQ